MDRSSAPRKCQSCCFLIYSRTSLSDVPFFHCRFGYGPYLNYGILGDCYNFAFFDHPDLINNLQLSFDF